MPSAFISLCYVTASLVVSGHSMEEEEGKNLVVMVTNHNPSSLPYSVSQPMFQGNHACSCWPSLPEHLWAALLWSLQVGPSQKPGARLRHATVVTAVQLDPAGLHQLLAPHEYTMFPANGNTYWYIKPRAQRHSSSYLALLVRSFAA